MLALPLVAAWTVALLDARDRDKAPPLSLALLMTLWSNMHGGFVFGLALIAPFRSRGGRCRAARNAPCGPPRINLFGLAAVAAALANPYGVEALLFPFRLIGVENLSRISEWSPQDFGHVGPIEIALLVLSRSALTRPMAAPPVRAAMLAGLLAIALQHARHAQLLGLIGPMLLAKPIAARRPRPCGRRGTDGRSRAQRWRQLSQQRWRWRRCNSPRRSCASTDKARQFRRCAPSRLNFGATTVLNDYSFGGYDLVGVRPFIDGRADMYGGAMLGLYRKLADGDPATSRKTLSRYRIAWTIFAPDAGIVATLDREPGWQRLYANSVAVVHVRGGAAPEAAGLGD